VIIDWHIHEAQSAKAEAIAFFKQMATDYGKYPHVIYEIWNEPLQARHPFPDAIVDNGTLG
jgi:endoglucanase